MNIENCDFVVIGAGITGLFLAKNLAEKYPNKKIIIIEKEKDVGYHTSGRNSGVIHAGIYYKPNSLKAKFCKEGNEFLTNYCLKNNIHINKVGKLIVPTNEKELEKLYEIYDRANKNQAVVKLVDSYEAKQIEPKVKVFQKAIWSPNTSTVNPLDILFSLKQELIEKEIVFLFNTNIFKINCNDNTLKVINGKRITIIKWREKFINCAGLYADKIAKIFGLAKHYIVLPFKGSYLQTNKRILNTNVYPVPLLDSFLGVHWTVYKDKTKIGPTAFPVLSRENYHLFENIKINELFQSVIYNLILAIKNDNYRKFALEEIKKYIGKNIFQQGLNLVEFDKEVIEDFKPSDPGIRAQILNTKTIKLEEDFIIEKTDNSIHVLNVVSPGFTSSYPFTKLIVNNYV